ncbi:hypothetical protein NLI96_g574 [Meripilus lineatus]|uniref:C2H2-type domain-containing protein n=1 Tax=Meripilus lineatus TaxID=2056292 RepID=A0AAD5YID6_9APHY|nr:hypothetical protein NLI96_g574 [Physisporinus lineatus]
MDLPLPTFATWSEEDNGNEDEEVYDEGEEELDDDDDASYDAQAQEIAKRLGDQLLADIAKAQLEAGITPSVVSHEENIQTTTGPSSTEPFDQVPPSKTTSSKFKKQGAALETMRTILVLASKDIAVQNTLRASVVHQINATAASNVFDILNQCVSSNSIPEELSRPLSDIIVSLAKSPTLFSSLRNSDAASIQLDKGKRKRDEPEEPARLAKKATIEYPDLLAGINEAVRVVLASFGHLAATSTTHRSTEPEFISSIHQQLHQIFLFSVTSAPRARPENATSLQELAGLIQMLGILSSTPIGLMPSPAAVQSPSNTPDIGSAVYPCLVPNCFKTFHRLYSLRTHQRVHTLVDRPFRCPHCPAGFLRNHDLKRHVKLHDNRAWKCGGCDKVFSRRDAIKRHQDNRGRGGKGKGVEGEGEPSPCAGSEIYLVEVEKEEGDEEASRRAKLWNGIVANQLAGASGGLSDAALHPPIHDGPEEGEIPGDIVQAAQVSVLRLHSILQAHVATALGTPNTVPGPAFPPYPAPPPGAHKTLASVLARSQPLPQPTGPPPMASLATLSGTQQQSDDSPSTTTNDSTATPSPQNPPNGLSWLSDEQTKLLEQAIAEASSAAQAQAEAEALLEEEDEGEEDGDDELT